MKIDINEVNRLCDRLAEINRTPLETIQWMDGDKPLEISPAVIERFKVTGLSNHDFVRCGVYKGILGLIND